MNPTALMVVRVLLVLVGCLILLGDGAFTVLGIFATGMSDDTTVRFHWTFPVAALLVALIMIYLGARGLR